MSNFDDLTPSEIKQAIAYAAVLQERDTQLGFEANAETQLARELPYLSRAVMTVRHRRARRNVQGVLAAFLALLGVSTVATFAHHRSVVANPPPLAGAVVPSKTDVPLHITIPPPGDELLSGLLLEPNYKLDIRSYDSGVPTNITFVNKSDGAVMLSVINMAGKVVPYYRLPPSKSITVYVDFNQFFLVTDRHRNRWLYCPSGRPTTAVITGDTKPLSLSSLHGYLKSTSTTQCVYPTHPGAPGTVYHQSGAWFTIVNLSHEPVNEYETGDTGVFHWNETVQPGDLVSGGSGPYNQWRITDAHQHLIGHYDPPPVSGVAVILPNRHN